MREVSCPIARGRRSHRRCGFGLVLFSILLLVFLGRAGADDFVYPAPDSAVYHAFVISAGGTIEVVVGTQITGNLHSNGNVDLRSDSTVTGNVSAVGQIVGGGTVTGTKTSGAAAVPLPSPFDEATARGLADRVFEGGVTFDTDQVINDVLFVKGDIRFRGSVNGTGTIISSGNIIFDNVTTGHSVVLNPSTRLSFSAALDISIGKIHPMRGVLVAGRDLIADKQLDITGVIVAGRNVRVHQDSKLVKLVLDRFPPEVAITSPANGAFVNTPLLRVTGTVTDDGVLAEVTVNGIATTVANGQFAVDVLLSEGINQLTARAVDSTGKEAFATAAATLDTQRPSLILDAPADGQLTNETAVRVSGLAEDANGIARVEVNGVAIPVSEGSFEGSSPLAEGDNRLTIRAVDVANNEQEVEVAVRRFTLPTVSITSPPDLSILAATTTEVHGTVTPGASVSVNGVVAVVSGTTFVATGVPLIEGGNILTATAVGGLGHVGTDTIHVVRDLTAPRVAIQYPKAGARLTEATVTATGLVNDIVPGTVNAAQATVTVNGQPAQVGNRSFMVEGVHLTLGDNVLTAVAFDASGNRGEASITVRREAGVPHIAILSGDGQEGTIGTPLPQPLTVALLDAAALPVVGKPVLFKVRGGNGTLDGGHREIAVTSGSDGRAIAHFTLGSRAGEGNQAIEVSAVGFRGAVFTASAQPSTAALIVVDAGDQQIGATGQALPRPLVAAVTDAGFNRLPNVPVRFTVVKGEGHFENGSQEALVFTDGDGRAIVPFVLDTEEGIVNNIVEAKIDALSEGPVVSFTATGRAAGDPAQTAISGVVLDNMNAPIAGVTLRILGSTLTTRTNGQGQFRIDGAPVGTVKLIVDGSTAERPGSWPDLEFVLATLPGRNNTVGMPIFLLPLNLQAGVYVDETRGGTLSLPEVPGFSLEIQPGSVTFPGGSKSGLVSVTVVHSDKVPMVPNFGQQPRFIITIQPAGARFDPPARLTLPNVEGLAPGTVTEFYSFDHDLGHFVSIGPGMVSEDGTVIASHPGVGIVKAGWHCGGNPGGTGTTHNCPNCQKCVNNRCVPEVLCVHNGCAAGSACDGRGNCRTGRALIPQICGQLGLTYADQTNLGCGGNCGAQIRFSVTRVTHSCDNIDMVGARVTETVTTDNGCGPGSVQTGAGCPVVAGNAIANCVDTYGLCGPAAAFPIGGCTETYTQNLSVDGCLAETRRIVFTITRTATSCSGTVTRN
jgi:hypothetical protein